MRSQDPLVFQTFLLGNLSLFQTLCVLSGLASLGGFSLCVRPSNPASRQIPSLLCPQTPEGGPVFCGDPLADDTCLPRLLLPSSALGRLAQYPGLQSFLPSKMLQMSPETITAFALSQPFPTQPGLCVSLTPGLFLMPPFFLGRALLSCPLSGSRAQRLQLPHGSSSLEDTCCSWVLFHMSVGYHPRNP